METMKQSWNGLGKWSYCVFRLLVVYLVYKSEPYEILIFKLQLNLKVKVDQFQTNRDIA